MGVFGGMTEHSPLPAGQVRSTECGEFGRMAEAAPVRGPWSGGGVAISEGKPIQLNVRWLHALHWVGTVVSSQNGFSFSASSP